MIYVYIYMESAVPRKAVKFNHSVTLCTYMLVIVYICIVNDVTYLPIYHAVWYIHISMAYGLVQERRDSIANALELRLSCTDPSISYGAMGWNEFQGSVYWKLSLKNI